MHCSTKVSTYFARRTGMYCFWEKNSWLWKVVTPFLTANFGELSTKLDHIPYITYLHLHVFTYNGLKSCLKERSQFLSVSLIKASASSPNVCLNMLFSSVLKFYLLPMFVSREGWLNSNFTLGMFFSNVDKVNHPGQI